MEATGLAMASAAFLGTHLAMSHPLRAPLVARMGEGAFLGVYSIVAFVTMGWMIWEARAMPPAALFWIVPPAGWSVASFVMLVASVLLVGSLMGNPALPDPTHSIRVPDRAEGVYAITRHPMLWSFILWALVHMLVWPTPRTFILGATIAILSLAGALGQDAKKSRLTGAPWDMWRARTAFVPFAGQLAGRIRWAAAWPGPVAVAGGLFLWLIATWAHPLAGGPMVGPWLMLG